MTDYDPPEEGHDAPPPEEGNDGAMEHIPVPIDDDSEDLDGDTVWYPVDDNDDDEPESDDDQLADDDDELLDVDPDQADG